MNRNNCNTYVAQLSVCNFSVASAEALVVAAGVEVELAIVSPSPLPLDLERTSKCVMNDTILI